MSNQDNPLRLIRSREVESRTGLGTTTIRSLVKHGDFPAPVRLGEGPTCPNAWVETEIDAWIRERIEVSRARAMGESAA